MVRKRLFRCFSAPEEPRRRSGECDGARFVVIVRESCQAGTIARQRLQVDTTSADKSTASDASLTHASASAPTTGVALLLRSLSPLPLLSFARSVGVVYSPGLRRCRCRHLTRGSHGHALHSVPEQHWVLLAESHLVGIGRYASPSPGAGGPKRLSDHERAATAGEETKRIGVGVEQTQEGCARLLCA